MPVLQVTREQVAALVQQLPPNDRRGILLELAGAAAEHSAQRRQTGEAAMRRICAARGLEYDILTDEERISVVDSVIHEDRVGAC
jgi:hypothetical protein